MAPAAAPDATAASLPLVSPALCLAARGAGGEAAWCVRLCPAGAISVEQPEGRRPGPTVQPGRCDGCGLCVRACPTGAFDEAPGGGARGQGGGPASAIRAAVEPGRELWVRCGRSKEAGGERRRGAAGPGPEVEVSCLGALGEAALLEAVAGGASSVQLDDRACGRCPRRRGMALARRAARRARRLAELFGRGTAIRFVHAPGSWKRLEPGSRRRFLLLGRSPPRVAAEPARSAALRRVPGGRRQLAACLERLGAPAARLVAAGAASLWAVAAAPACDACGACAALCPTEALELREDAAGATLLHRPLWCTGCGACMARCPRRALAARDPVPSAFLTVPRLPLATAARRRCAACGRPAGAASAGALCADCRVRRELAASFSAPRRELAR
jgi:ferredoxin